MAIGIHDELNINYPEDIKKLKELIPEIRPLDDSIIDLLYSDYSTSWMCAGWMFVSKSSIEEFKLYLLTEHRHWPVDKNGITL